MKAFNLIEKYQKDKILHHEIKEYKSKLSSEHPKYNVGDVITFNAGYHNDYKVKTEIIGFDADGDIYVLWDCYWSPIKDNEERNIIKS